MVVSTFNSAQPTEIRTLVLQGLPVIPGDDDFPFFKSGLVSDHRNSILDVPVGILFEGTDLQPPNSLHLSSSIGIILEGQVVMDNMQDLSQAMCLLFGLIYALDLNIPKSLTNTFDFIQCVLMSMEQNTLKPKVQSLANQLFYLRKMFRSDKQQHIYIAKATGCVRKKIFIITSRAIIPFSIPALDSPSGVIKAIIRSVFIRREPQLHSIEGDGRKEIRER
ncbi:uncharacterized protein LOC128602375 [Ictalurus furcatus]|uniref:uncharacterized protein LOC128602375 n=1 Tax=Ictalurus furcatus TaxID=66913 RepID=UPI00235035CB|nr:uncharacterized protein LOC128602375 [Ictalurus furcatus]